NLIGQLESHDGGVQLLCHCRGGTQRQSESGSGQPSHTSHSILPRTHEGLGPAEFQPAHEGWQAQNGQRVGAVQGNLHRYSAKQVKAMIEVHHLNNSRSQRVLWLLEELDLPYDIVPYQRDPKTRLAPPDLKAVHPLGKSPVIRDAGLIVAESGAIIEYLVG